MTLARYGEGLALLAAALGPLAIGAVVTRRWLFGMWSGALARLAELMLVLASLLGVAQALGAVGIFSIGPLVIGCATVGAIATVVGRRRASGRPVSARQPVQPVDRTEVVVAAIACALVFGMWATWVAQAFDFGVGNSDSLWYHLPIAARFAQDGSFLDAHFLNAEALVTYYPANASVLHGVGMLAFHRDAFSLVLNLVLLPVALLAGWCLGTRSGTSPVALVGVAVALAVPIMALTQPGSGKDDLLSIVGLLCAIAFLDNAGRSRAAFMLSGAAAGIALGTKLTMLVPVAAFALAIILVARPGSRRRVAGCWVIGLIATGSFWYVRNLIAIGNPMPSIDLPLGLPTPAVPSIGKFGTAMADYLGDGSSWAGIFRPGLERALGSVGLVVIALAVIGSALAVARGRGVRRASGLTAAAVLVAFAFTPGTAYGVGLVEELGGRDTAELIFAYNLRYLVPGLALGLALLPADRWFAGRVPRLTILGTYLTILFLTQASASGNESWAPGHGAVGPMAAVAVLSAFAIFGVRGHLPRFVPLIVGALAIAGIVAMGAPALDRHYRTDRFQFVTLERWAKHRHGQRIALAGFALQYPLYGDDLSNHVQVVGRRGPDGSFSRLQSCRNWRRALRAGHYDFVAVPTSVPVPELGFDLGRWNLGAPDGEPPLVPPESVWTRTDPAAELVFEQGGASVYRVGPRIDVRSCSS